MTPIFKNTEVSLKDIGEFMQEYAKQQNIKDVPRSLLIGSYFGKKNRTFDAFMKMVFRTRTCHLKHLHCCQICT